LVKKGKSMLSLLFYLIAGHFIADYPLQSDTIGINKHRLAKTELQKYVPWYYWLTGHAFTHGAMVGLATGIYWLGCLETIAHFLIDLGKCEKKYGLVVDHILHFICKIIWLVIWCYCK